MTTTSPTTDLAALITEYREAVAEQGRIGTLDCHISNLVTQVEKGNRRPWVAEAVTEFGRTPTRADVDRIRGDRLAARDRVRAVSAPLYRALLEAGQAFEVVDHSDRLASRPFEIAPARETAHTLGVSFVTAHGSHIRLARYGSRAAAEKALAKLTEKELARLDAASAQDGPSGSRPSF